MKNTLTIIFCTCILISCNNETYTCTCKNGDAMMESHQLEMDKKSASFECKQKSLKYSGKPEFENVKCVLDE